MFVKLSLEEFLTKFRVGAESSRWSVLVHPLSFDKLHHRLPTVVLGYFPLPVPSPSVYNFQDFIYVVSDCHYDKVHLYFFIEG